MTNPEHWPNCATDGGPAHYECAVAEIKRLKDDLTTVSLAFGGAVAEMEAEITRLRALTTPQPIETAPDRTTCSIFIDEFPWPVTARRTHGRWSVIHPDLGWALIESRPTRWLPLTTEDPK